MRSPASAPRAGRALRDALLVAGVAAVSHLGSYGFEIASIGADRGAGTAPAGGRGAGRGRPAAGLAAGAAHPGLQFPQGLAVQMFHAANQATWTAGYNHQFLFGQNSPNGWWYYFPLAMAVKTPCPSWRWWAGPWSSLRKPAIDPAGAPAVDLFDIILLVVPAVLWLAFCMLLTINIGIRYLLPMFPLLAILMGALGPQVVGRAGRWPPLLVLLLWQAAGTLVLSARARLFQRADRGLRRGLALRSTTRPSTGARISPPWPVTWKSSGSPSPTSTISVPSTRGPGASVTGPCRRTWSASRRACWWSARPA